MSGDIRYRVNAAIANSGLICRKKKSGELIMKICLLKSPFEFSSRSAKLTCVELADKF